MQFNNSDFSTPPYPTYHSLRHFPRSAPSRGPDHTTLIIIIAISIAVGGLLLAVLIWRFLSRLSRPKSAPLPPRQSLVHQRELHLAAFTEYKDVSSPQMLTSDYHIHEMDTATLGSSDVHLHAPSPQFFPSRPSGSYSSLPSCNDDASSSGAATPPTQISTSTSLNQSFRRAMSPSGPGPRPLSTFSTSSRQSVRGAPHAPHSNVQIILPAPLAPNLYERTASDGLPLARNGTYSVRDSWRKSLADSWIPVGQPNSEPMERHYGHDSVERPSRLIRRGSSPGPGPRSPRSRSNPSSPSRLRTSLGHDQPPEGTYPPVPPVPSEYGGLSGHHAFPPTTPSRKGGSLTPSPPSTHSHNPRS